MWNRSTDQECLAFAGHVVGFCFLRSGAEFAPRVLAPGHAGEKEVLAPRGRADEMERERRRKRR